MYFMHYAYCSTPHYILSVFFSLLEHLFLNSLYTCAMSLVEACAVRDSVSPINEKSKRTHRDEDERRLNSLGYKQVCTIGCRR